MVMDVLALVPLVVLNVVYPPLPIAYSHLLQLTLEVAEMVTVVAPVCVTDTETVGAALSIEGRPLMV
jgi:hypothetical protein